MRRHDAASSFGITASELLQSAARWRVHSVFDNSINLVRIPDVAPRAPHLLHLSTARPGTAAAARPGCPFGVELNYREWQRLRAAAQDTAGSIPWHWQPERRQFRRHGDPIVSLPSHGLTQPCNCHLPALGMQPVIWHELAEHTLPKPAFEQQAEMAHHATQAMQTGSRHAAVRHLIGRGQGLTPSGDDTLIGIMAILTAAGLPQDSQASQHELGTLISRGGRQLTTDISCAYLCAATRGRFALPLRRIFHALPISGPGKPDSTPLAQAIDNLLQVGHSSGADTLIGLIMAARALTRASLTGQ